MEKIKREVPLFSVSEYVSFVNELTAMAPVLVEGEISNFRDIPGRNFCYFDIKDQSAVARCFQGFWRSEKILLNNGSTVRVFGYPTLQKNGTLVIDVKEVLLVGAGELRRRYQELKAKLTKEGLFDIQTKQKLPSFPLTIGLIAGKNSSAYYDVTAELAERWGGVEIFFCGVKVQGVNAKAEIVDAIQYFNRKKRVDLLIVARGGGSAEDLQAFDTEEVVREIFASKIPIISAIGHEDHWTLADLVADVRAKTPTKAAQIAVPSRVEVTERLDFLTIRSKGLIKAELEEVTGRLSVLGDRLEVDCQNQLRGLQQELQLWQARLQAALKQAIHQKQQQLTNFEKLLKLLNPQDILARGYGAVQKNGKRIVDVQKVKVGDKVIIRLQNGEINSKIQEVKEF